MRRGTKTSPGEQPAGFTLIEVLAVLVIILIIAGLTMAISRYAMKSANRQRTSSQLAQIAAALEAYKLDYGVYPTSTVYRISANGWTELSNTWYLYSALSNKYLRLPSKQLMSPQTISSIIGTVTGIVDVYGRCLNYYCTYPPNPTESLGTGVTLGGQVNLSSFDLFSYGPNHTTYVTNSSWAPSFVSASLSVDDIWSNP